MAHFTQISLTDFFAFFGFPASPEPVTGAVGSNGWVRASYESMTEWTFDFPVGKAWPGVYVRVLTSVPYQGQKVRGAGTDAIRVFVVDLGNKRGVVKAVRVHRVAGWKVNLQREVKAIWTLARERMSWLARSGRWTPGVPQLAPGSAHPDVKLPPAPPGEFVPAGSTAPNELF